MIQHSETRIFNFVSIVQKSVGPDHEYRTSVIASFVFAILYGYLEYYYILQARLVFVDRSKRVFTYHLVPVPRA